ncbi:MAG: sodium:solute symporter [Bacteroidia bacterium]|nr:sodium:solute symporter [Bacteroidia bacterium]
MDVYTTLSIVIAYFGLLFVVSWLTGRNADDSTFFSANKSSPWYLVAFGMIGATLSGITFISVPGAVGGGHWAYLQFVLGNTVGFILIALILLPLYYRLNLTSIYGYLEQRFGFYAYKTGAFYFLLSRVIGASLRMYIVALVLQLALFDQLGVPFAMTVLISIALIYIYTFRGGIKTVVWTDTLQTFCILLGAGITVYIIGDKLNMGIGEMISTVASSEYAETFFWDIAPANNFFKQFISGIFITIAMVGLDQDMMQKNLTCPNLKDAQKNVYSFTSVFLIANIFFLGLGALLYIYGLESGILQMAEGDCSWLIKDPTSGAMVCLEKSDQLFPIISLNYLGPVAGIVFVLAVIAAAYSSADSALTALTTSFCVDILDFEKRDDTEQKRKTRYLVHVGFAFILFLVILGFNALSDDAVVYEIFRLAGYTYGPLLGMFVFGMMTDRKVNDQAIPYICIAAPVLTYLINLAAASMDFGIGFMLLVVNGILTIALLYAFPAKS